MRIHVAKPFHIADQPPSINTNFIMNIGDFEISIAADNSLGAGYDEKRGTHTCMRINLAVFYNKDYVARNNLLEAEHNKLINKLMKKWVGKENYIDRPSNDLFIKLLNAIQKESTKKLGKAK